MSGAVRYRLGHDFHGGTGVNTMCSLCGRAAADNWHTPCPGRPTTHWVCAPCLTEEAKQKEPVYDMVVGALDIPGKCDRCGKGGELVASMRVRT